MALRYLDLLELFLPLSDAFLQLLVLLLGSFNLFLQSSYRNCNFLLRAITTESEQQVTLSAERQNAFTLPFNKDVLIVTTIKHYKKDKKVKRDVIG